MQRGRKRQHGPRQVRVAAPDVDILVVDDNNPDGTAAPVVIQPRYVPGRSLGRTEGSGRVSLFSRAEKDGLSAAYRTGFAWALAYEHEALVQMDAELSHPPSEFPRSFVPSTVRTSPSSPATSREQR